MKHSTWVKAQGCYNAIMIPILAILGIISPIMLVIFLNEPGPKDEGAIFAFGCFVLMDLAVITWFIRNRVKESEERRQLSEKYHSRDRAAQAAAGAGDAKYMKICPRCLWIPHSKCDWVAHKGTEQEKCYFCNIPLATTNCTEEEFNGSDELKELVFEYFASQNAYNKDIYEKRCSNDRVLIKVKAERRRQEKQQNQQPPQSRPYQPSPATQSQPQPPLPTLTTCPVCGGKVSTAATACPHCGQPLSAGRIAPH